MAPCHDLPLLLQTGMEVALVPPALKGPRWFVITNCTDSDSAQCVSFEGVDDLSGACALVGRTVLARRCDLPADLKYRDPRVLVGRKVLDERYGVLGCVEEVMRGPAQDVWVVRGPYGEVLIPAVEQVVRDLPDEGPIRCDLPKGLVENGAIDDWL